MTEGDRTINVTYQAPADWTARRRVTKLIGDELPAEVTAQPLTIGVWNTTEGLNAEGRPVGWVAYSLNIGGREDPEDLSQDEREYVARMLEHAALDFRSGHALRPESFPSPADEGKPQ